MNALNIHVKLINWIFNHEFTTAGGHLKGVLDTNCRNLSRNSYFIFFFLRIFLLFSYLLRSCLLLCVFSFFFLFLTRRYLVVFKGLELVEWQGCSVFAYLQRDAPNKTHVFLSTWLIKCIAPVIPSIELQQVFFSILIIKIINIDYCWIVCMNSLYC